MANITSNQLIIRSLYLINEYSPNELPSAEDITEGLFFLNSILANMSGNGIFIPYVTSINFNTEANKQVYRMGTESTADINSTKLVEPFDAYIIYNSAQIPLEIIPHDRFFQLVRYPLTTTRPTQIFFQNDITGTQVYFWSTPDTVYPVYIRGKFALGNIIAQQDLSMVPDYYNHFLIYALARSLNSVFGADKWDEIRETEYQRAMGNITSQNDIDFSITSSAILKKRSAVWTKNELLVGRGY